MGARNFCTALVTLVFACGYASAQACDPGAPPGARTLSKPAAQSRIAYRTDPAKLDVDQMFSVLIHLCAAQPIERLTVDAHMPEHRHGMNYKPAVVRQADGSYRATGFLFHMPGKWEFVFEARVGGKTERFTDSIRVE